MASPDPRTHRASAQRRRAALLTAARDLVGEVGAGAVTHRAVAARAGVPLSTTSYFFDSIDELIAEALRDNGRARTSAFDDAERVWVLHDDQSTAELLGQVAKVVADTSPVEQAAAVETYLAAARSDEVRDSTNELVERFAQRTAQQMERAGIADSTDLAWAILALVEGTGLHRLGGIDGADASRLEAGFRMLLAGAALTEAERDDAIRRVDDHRGIGSVAATR